MAVMDAVSSHAFMLSPSALYYAASSFSANRQLNSGCSEFGWDQTDPVLPYRHPRPDILHQRWNRVSRSQVDQANLPVSLVRKCRVRRRPKLRPDLLLRLAEGYFRYNPSLLQFSAVDLYCTIADNGDVHVKVEWNCYS